MWKLRLFNFFYYILIISFLFILYKFGHDFYIANKYFSRVFETNDESEVNKIIKPRFQLERAKGDFEFMEADYMKKLENNNLFFENIKMRSNFGNMKAGKLDIVDENNHLIFSDNPKLEIFVD